MTTRSQVIDALGTPPARRGLLARRASPYERLLVALGAYEDAAQERVDVDPLERARQAKALNLLLIKIVAAAQRYGATLDAHSPGVDFLNTIIDESDREQGVIKALSVIAALDTRAAPPTWQRAVSDALTGGRPPRSRPLAPLDEATPSPREPYGEEKEKEVAEAPPEFAPREKGKEKGKEKEVAEAFPEFAPRSLAAITELGEKLGSGAFGEVLRTDVHNRVVKRQLNGAEALEYEARSLLDVAPHPNIVRVFRREPTDTGVPEHGAAIYKYIRGQTLQAVHERLTNTYLSGEIRPYEFAGCVQVLGADIMAGIAHLHGHRVIHGDLHFQNVMLGHVRSRAHLIDVAATPVGESGQAGGNKYLVDSPEFFRYLASSKPKWMQQSVGKFGQRVFSKTDDAPPLAGGVAEIFVPGWRPDQPTYQLELEVNAAGRLATDPLERLRAGDAEELGAFWDHARAFAHAIAQDPEQRPTAQEALQHPYLDPANFLIGRYYADAIIKSDEAAIERFRGAKAPEREDLEAEADRTRHARS